MLSLFGGAAFDQFDAAGIFASTAVAVASERTRAVGCGDGGAGVIAGVRESAGAGDAEVRLELCVGRSTGEGVAALSVEC